MMIDDDDVALHRAAVHLGNEASLPGTAFLPQASVGTRVELVPKRAGFGQRCQLRPVARLRGFLPRSNRPIVLNFADTAELRLISQVVELFPAEVISASFHIADAQLALAIRKERLL